jgi:hypothetical protein
MEKEKIYKKQHGKCFDCGNHIVFENAKFILGKGFLPEIVVCNGCRIERLKNDLRKSKGVVSRNRQLEKADWLNPSLPQYQLRLECSEEGHIKIGRHQGYAGGGCRCGYFLPHERDSVRGDYQNGHGY